MTVRQIKIVLDVGVDGDVSDQMMSQVMDEANDALIDIGHVADIGVVAPLDRAQQVTDIAALLHAAEILETTLVHRMSYHLAIAARLVDGGVIFRG